MAPVECMNVDLCGTYMCHSNAVNFDRAVRVYAVARTPSRGVFHPDNGYALNVFRFITTIICGQVVADNTTTSYSINDEVWLSMHSELVAPDAVSLYYPLDPY